MVLPTRQAPRSGKNCSGGNCLDEVANEERHHAGAQGIDRFIVWSAENFGVGRGAFVPVGDGVVDFAGLAAVLDGVGYDGWYVLEHDIRRGAPWPDQDPQANAAQSRDRLRAFLA